MRKYAIYKNNEQKCFVIAKDPQNLFLSSQFNLEKNKRIRNISSFDYNDDNTENIVDNDIIKLLKKKSIYFYEYNFKFTQKEDFCNVMVGNGTTISQIKTPKSSEKILKNLLVSINNKEKRGGGFFNKDYDKDEHLAKDEFPTNDNKVMISLHKSVLPTPSKPFSLKFFYKNKENPLDIAYSQIKYLQNLALLPSQLNSTEYNDYNEDDYSGTFFGYFLSSRIFKKNNGSIKDYICEASPLEYENVIHTLKYSVFLNDNLIFSKQSSKGNISFEIKNIKPTDTITCQVGWLDNKIESSSYTNLDNTKKSSYCYALDKNYSILSFECPDNIDINQTSNEMKKMLKNKLLSQYKVLNNITYAHMTLWTQSQKNKISITAKVDDGIEE